MWDRKPQHNSFTISPCYVAIRDRAFEILTREAGFGGYTAKQISEWGKGGGRPSVDKDTIKLALEIARNGLMVKLGVTPESVGFDKPNFKNAYRDIELELILRHSRKKKPTITPFEQVTRSYRFRHYRV
jgi:hypothetical protein